MSAKQQQYTTPQATAALGLSIKEIQRLCRAGKFDRKIGRDWLITACEIEKYRSTPHPRGYPKGRPRRRKPVAKTPPSE